MKRLQIQWGANLPLRPFYAEYQRFNPPEADKDLIPRRLRRYIAFVDTPLLCGGVVHSRGIYEEEMKWKKKDSNGR
jgi:hypothetical protein